MNDSRDFQDAESVRSGHSHVASQPVSFPPHQDPGGMLSRSLRMPSRKNGPPSIWGTHGISGNVFANRTASSSAPCPQVSNPWGSNVSEHTSPHVMSESQTPVQDQRCQSVNKLARSITKWTEGCDKRLSRLISYIHYTCEHKQYCHVGNTVKQCRLGLFQDSDFAGDLEDSKSSSGRTLFVFGSHTFVPISWMCKKQTSVSRSSTESEIISLDAG